MILGSLLLLSLASSALSAPQSDPIDSQISTQVLTTSENKELLYLHRKLIEIESITGNEENVGKWLQKYLESKNFTVELQEVTPKRYNVLAYGKKKDTTILVTSHIDTVPPFWPYEYDRNREQIWGRGSVDAKGSVAAQVIAVLGLKEKLLDDLSLLFVVGEETGGDGMKYFSDHPANTYDVVIFGEPTEGKLVCGHKGMLGFTVKITGKAAHSGYPWLGVSANDVLTEALGKLLKLRYHLPWSEKYGNTTMNFGRIEGGVAANVVAETAEVKIATRLAAATPEIVKGMIVDALEEVKSKVEELGGGLKIEWAGEGYPPVNIDCDVEGFEKMTVNYGTDIPNFQGEHNRYLYGPGNIFVAHSDHESIKVEDLEQAVLDFRRLIIATSMMHHQRHHRQQEQLEL